MGNSAGKEARNSSHTGHSRPGSSRLVGSSSASGGNPTSPTAATSDRVRPEWDGRRSSRGGRSSELAFLSIGGSSRSDGPAQPEVRRETRAEREARRLERERAARLKERERSVKTESVDGGYLVTLGVYTGTEDFSKPVVRQLMVSILPRNGAGFSAEKMCTG